MATFIPTINQIAALEAPLLWRAAWQGGLALLLVLLLAWAIRAIPARVQCWLWRLALLKLLIAGLWIAPLELHWLPPAQQERVAVSAGDEWMAPMDSFDAPAEAVTVPSVVVEAAPAAESEGLHVASWLLLVWLLGVTVSLAHLLRQWVRVRRATSMLPQVADERLHALVAESCRRHGIRSLPELRLAPDGVGPCLVGIVRPVIVLPSSLVQSCFAEQFDVALEHELAHIRRRDLLWNWLPALAQVVFFFHPLVWLARRRLHLVQEIATDELALSVSNVNAASYARSLVELAARHPGDATPQFALAVADSYSQLSHRIQAMKTFQRLTVRHRLTLAAGVAAIAALGIVPWRLTAQETPARPQGPISQQPSESGGESTGEFVDTHWNADPADDVFRKGAFKRADTMGRPIGWTDVSAFDRGYAKLDTEKMGFVTLNAPMSKREVSIGTTLDLPPDAEYLTFLVRLRGPKIKRDEKPGAGGGVVFSLIDDKGRERLLPRIDASYSGYRNWFNEQRTARILPGERQLRVRIVLNDAEGNLDVDRIQVVPSDPEGEVTEEQRRALSLAVARDDVETVARMIKENPRLLEIRSGEADNGTPLILASWFGSEKVAAKLIELGADVEATDYNWHNSSLRWCCFWGVPDVGEVLLEAGADTRNALRMAQNAKANNRLTRHTPEEFDRLIKLLEQHEAKQPAK